MVSPEGIGSEPDRPGSGRGLLFAIAGLVIAGGFVALGALSPSGDVAVETTTTTMTPATTTTTRPLPRPFDPDNFQMSQIETGEPLDLTKTTTLSEGYPLAALEHNGGHYIFMTGSSHWLASEGGMLVWHSPDGASWEPLGEVIGDRFRVTRVISTDTSLIAVGSSIDDNTVMIWESEDAIAWQATEVTVGIPSSYTVTFPTAVGSNGDITMIATATGYNTQGMLEAALLEAGYEFDLSRLAWGLDVDSEGNEIVTLHGPLGIPLARAPLADLDLTDEERQAISEGNLSDPEAILWTHDPGSEWTETTNLEALHSVETITRGPEGELVIRGWGDAGRMTATSDDGAIWILSETTDPGPWHLEHWGAMLVGPDEGPVPEILVSGDGANWETTGLASHFPPSGIHWSAYPLGAGPAGVVAVVSGFNVNQQSITTEPVTLLTDKGHTLSLDLGLGPQLSVDNGDLSHVWDLHDGVGGDDLLVDPTQQTIELLHPEAGISFGVVTFEQLREAEMAFYSSLDRNQQHLALAFTPDGETWTIQDLSETIGSVPVITQLMVGTDRLMAIVAPDGYWYYPKVDPTFEVWTAPLP